MKGDFGSALIGASTVLLGFWALYRLEKRDRLKKVRAWNDFAVARGLGVAAEEPGRGPQLAGAVRGVTVALVVEYRMELGKYQPTTVLRCDLGGVLPTDFALAKASTAGAVLARLKSGEGEPSLPELSAFRLERVGEARALLGDGAVQAKLLELVKRYPGLRIGNGVLQLEDWGYVGSLEALDTLLEDGLQAVWTLRRAANPELGVEADARVAQQARDRAR